MAHVIVFVNQRARTHSQRDALCDDADDPELQLALAMSASIAAKQEEEDRMETEEQFEVLARLFRNVLSASWCV